MPDELTLLLKASDQGRNSRQLKSILLFAIETGMRLGELLRLQWADIDQQRRLAKFLDTKNGEARTILLSQSAICILAAVPHHITIPRVFWSWKKADSFENAWRRNLTRARELYSKECLAQGIIPDTTILQDIRFHDTRHEATSCLFEKGLNPMEVATITGHKTLSMLMRYIHLRPESLLAKLG